MHKKDTDREKQVIRKRGVDPESIDGPAYEHGHATQSELRRRRLVVLRHSAGIQLVATAPLVPLAADALRHGQPQVAVLALLALAAGIAGSSYGWAVYGRVARLAAEGIGTPAPSRQMPRGIRSDSRLHKMFFVGTALAASVMSSVPMYSSLLIACPVVAYGACNAMWEVVGMESCVAEGDSGDGTGRD